MKKNHNRILGIIAIILIIGVGISGYYLAAAKRKQAETAAYLETPYLSLVELSVANNVALTTANIKNTTFTLAIADNSHKGARGLANISSIEPNQGMIYLYDRDGIFPHSTIGMKFDLDIVWVDKDNKVVHIEENISPDTKEINPTSEARYVLELSPESINSTNLKIGDEIEVTI